MKLSLALLLTVLASQAFARNDLLEKIDKIAEHAAEQEATIERFDKNFYRKEGFIILKKRNSELTQLHGQLVKGLLLMTSELNNLTNENTRLSAEVEQLVSDNEELQLKIDELQRQLDSNSGPKEWVCVLKVFGQDFIGSSTKSEDNARIKAKAKCVQKFHEVQCQNTATCR